MYNGLKCEARLTVCLHKLTQPHLQTQFSPQRLSEIGIFVLLLVYLEKIYLLVSPPWFIPEYFTSKHSDSDSDPFAVACAYLSIMQTQPDQHVQYHSMFRDETLHQVNTVFMIVKGRLNTAAFDKHCMDFETVLYLHNETNGVPNRCPEKQQIIKVQLCMTL